LLVNIVKEDDGITVAEVFVQILPDYEREIHINSEMVSKGMAVLENPDIQGKRILFLECLLDKGFADYLILLIKFEPLAGQGFQNLDAFALVVIGRRS
jgi:hypothetical protein